MTTVKRCHEGTDRLGRRAKRPEGLEQGMRPLEFCQKNVTGSFGKCSSSKVKSSSSALRTGTTLGCVCVSPNTASTEKDSRFSPSQVSSNPEKDIHVKIEVTGIKGMLQGNYPTIQQKGRETGAVTEKGTVKAKGEAALGLAGSQHD